jgi:hypothetical protein
LLYQPHQHWFVWHNNLNQKNLLFWLSDNFLVSA